MANSKEYRIKKDRAFEAYIAGMTSPTELADYVGCSVKTVYNWIGQGKWNRIEVEQRKLERDIVAARKAALLAALREYAKDPKNTALQSLVGMLKAEIKREQPSKELRDYIVKFLDQVTDFYIERGLEVPLKMFQGSLIDLAEYLRQRNG